MKTFILMLAILAFLLATAGSSFAQPPSAPGLTIFFLDTSTSMDMGYKKYKSRWMLVRELAAKIGSVLYRDKVDTAIYSFSPFRTILPSGIHTQEDITRALYQAGDKMSSSEDIVRDLKELDVAIDQNMVVSVIMMTDGLLPYSRDAAAYLSNMALRRGERLRFSFVSLASNKDGIRNIKRMRSSIPNTAYGWADTLLDSDRAFDKFVDFAVYDKSRLARPKKTMPKKTNTATKPQDEDKKIILPDQSKQAIPIKDLLVLRLEPDADGYEYLMPGLVYALTMMAANRDAVFELKVFQDGRDDIQAQMETQLLAERLKQWFVNKGVGQDNISANGMGGKNPRFAGQSILNSRVEIGVR